MNDTKVSPSKTEEEEDSSAELDIEELRRCKSVTENIITELLNLKIVITSHHGNVLRVKTTGTTATTIGTVLGITGLIMAPFTLGASLIVTSVGALTSLGGAAANMITDVVDRSKSRSYVQNIQKLAEEQQTCKNELSKQLNSLHQILEPFLAQGLSRQEALYVALIQGDRNDEEEDEAVEYIEVEGKWKTVKKFAFNASIHSLKLIQNSQSLSALAVATSSGAATANATSNISMGVTMLLGNIVLKTSMAAVGVIFTSIDIALLVKQWKAANPTVDSVDLIIQEFQEEVKQYEELLELLETAKNCKCFVTKCGNVMIFGTSPFAVKALTALVKGDVEKAAQYYGASGDKRFDLDKCWVTFGDEEFDPKSILSSTQGFTETEPVINIQDLMTQHSTDGELETVEIIVIDQSILRLNAEVIDEFLKIKNFPSFLEIEKILKHNSSPSTCIEDYRNPLPNHVTTTIKQVLVAYLKVRLDCNGYYNGNKWEYDLLLGLIKEKAVAYLCMEYAKVKAISEDSNCADGDEIGNLVEVLINHKSYLDPVASAVWTSKSENNENVILLEKTLKNIENLFRSLRLKIPLWAYELSEIKQ